MRALGLIFCILLAAPLCADEFENAAVGPGPGGDWIVPTYQRIEPHGRHVLFPGRPTGIAVRSDGGAVAVLNRSDLIFLDPASGEIRHTLPLKGGGHAVTGICFSADGRRVYTSTTGGAIAIASCPGEEAPQWVGRLELPTDRGKPQPAGLALGPESNQLLVCLGRRNTLGLVDVSTGALVKETDVGIAPFDVVVVGRRAYVTNWGGDRPAEGDATGPTSGSQVKVDARAIACEGSVSVVDLDAFAAVRSIRVGRHACGMALHPDGRHLFVANANEDTVSVIDTETDEVVETIAVRPRHILPFGSAPNAVAVGPRGTLLAVANGGNNAVAVVRLGRRAGGQGRQASAVAGFVPVGWYPGAVAVSPDGRRLWVANTKGVGSRAKPEGRAGYNTHQHMGSVSAIDLPLRGLRSLTERVARNNRESFALAGLSRARASADPVPVPLYQGERSVFKHVLYIIKENRTYDQVFGDMAEGNGAPELCHFGEEVTPNHHALAREFGLFDNLYCSGILSADGHQWTDAAYVTDYIEKAFGGFIRSYPYAGGDALAYASSGFLWDNALEHGLSLRIYGEFVRAVIEPRASWSEIYRDYLDQTGKISITARANIATIEPYICPTFIGFPGTVTDVYRAGEFIKELQAAEEAGEWHNLMIMLLPNDHTVGTRPGLPTPRAAVADNDLALGRIVEAVTHSRFWPETIIFVIEDDPQAGLDHVDGHRTVGFVISPYNRRGIVDSHFYAQTSIVRTIELILGLPPMNQFDLGATPITTCFQETPDLRPYAARPNRIPLDELNPPLEALSGPALHWARVSLDLDLDEIDEADEDTFNRVLWHSVKGYDVPYPNLSVPAGAG